MRTFNTFERAAALMLGAAMLAFPFGATALRNGPDDKVTICHATSSAGNPYVTIHTSENAINGHFDNNGTPLAGHEDDILFPGDVDCPDGANGGGGGGGGAQAHKVTICHATESDTNPFVRIVVDSHATAGHFDNNGTPLAGHEDDILFPGEHDCPAGGGGGASAAQGALTVIKSVINDDGGSAQASDFSIAVTSATSGSQVAGSPQPGSSSGTTYMLAPGSYSVSELAASSSYATTFSGSCNSLGVVLVQQNGTSTCTIINNDIATTTHGGGGGGAGGNTGTLIVKKVVINDNGGMATSSSFTISVATATGSPIIGSPFAGSFAGTVRTVPAGTYTVSELATSSYAGAFGGACNGNGVVTVTAGATSTCVITNNDIATSTCNCGGGGGGGGQFGLLTIIKHTDNGNGTFDFAINGSTVATTSISTFAGVGIRIVPLLGLGTTTLSEIAQSGWSFASASCVQNGFATGTSSPNGFTFNFNVQGGAVVCNIFNTATTTATSTPGGGGGGTATTTTGSIVVKKVVVNSGTPPSDFLIHIKNATSSAATTSVDIAGSPRNGTSTGSVYMNVATGTYMISETGGSGSYTVTFSGACDSTGILIVTAGATSTCTITNIFAVQPNNSGGGSGGGGSSGVLSSGGNGPISGILPVNGNGPILGGGGFFSGQVLGAATSIPDGMGGFVPGVPNTGAGGTAAGYLALMLLSLVIVTHGTRSLRRT